MLETAFIIRVRRSQNSYQQAQGHTAGVSMFPVEENLCLNADPWV